MTDSYLETDGQLDRAFVELRELEPGDKFVFYADDLEDRGPYELVEKRAGTAVIKTDAREVTRTFTARDEKTGELTERAITTTVSGERPCSLGAQVLRV